MTGLLPAPRTPLESPTASVGLDFVAFDVETANSRRGSICAIGAAVVRGGVVVSTHSWLTRPPAGLDHFDGFNVGLHGITPDIVADQPAFSERLDQLLELTGGLPLVAHNRARFSLEQVEELQRELAHVFGVADVNALPPRGALKHIAPVRMKLPMRRAVLVELGGHLRQQAIAQAQRREVEATAPSRAKQRRVNRRACNDDLRSLRVDALERGTLVEFHLRQMVIKLLYL